MPVCKTTDCGAAIVYATRHDDRTKHMPIDLGSEGKPEGEYAIWQEAGPTGAGTGPLWYRKLGKGEEPDAAKGERRAVSHYRTCKRPSDHSRGARG